MSAADGPLRDATFEEDQRLNTCPSNPLSGKEEVEVPVAESGETVPVSKTAAVRASLSSLVLDRGGQPRTRGNSPENNSPTSTTSTRRSNNPYARSVDDQVERHSPLMQFSSPYDHSPNTSFESVTRERRGSVGVGDCTAHFAMPPPLPPPLLHRTEASSMGFREAMGSGYDASPVGDLGRAEYGWDPRMCAPNMHMEGFGSGMRCAVHGGVPMGVLPPWHPSANSAFASVMTHPCMLHGTSMPPSRGGKDAFYQSDAYASKSTPQTGSVDDARAPLGGTTLANDGSAGRNLRSDGNTSPAAGPAHNVTDATISSVTIHNSSSSSCDPADAGARAAGRPLASRAHGAQGATGDAGAANAKPQSPNKSDGSLNHVGFLPEIIVVRIEFRRRSERFLVRSPARTLGVCSAPLLEGAHVIVEGDRGFDLGRIASVDTDATTYLMDLLPRLAHDDLRALHGAENAMQLSDFTKKDLPEGESPASHQSANEAKNPLVAFAKFPFVLRNATQEEVDDYHTSIVDDEHKALLFAREQAARLIPGTELIDAAFQFDKNKLILWYRSSERVYFVPLLKVLNQRFRCRIWMERIERVFDVRAVNDGGATGVSAGGTGTVRGAKSGGGASTAIPRSRAHAADPRHAAEDTSRELFGRPRNSEGTSQGNSGHGGGVRGTTSGTTRAGHNAANVFGARREGWAAQPDGGRDEHGETRTGNLKNRGAWSAALHPNLNDTPTETADATRSNPRRRGGDRADVSPVSAEAPRDGNDGRVARPRSGRASTGGESAFDGSGSTEPHSAGNTWRNAATAPRSTRGVQASAAGGRPDSASPKETHVAEEVESKPRGSESTGRSSRRHRTAQGSRAQLQE